jgi:hypothetical protein
LLIAHEAALLRAFAITRAIKGFPMSQYSLFDDDTPPKGPRSTRNDVRTGDAAEALVLFKLLNWGFDAHDARRDLPYDIVVDVGDGRICRVQVKGRRNATRGRWNYRATRGNWRSATGTYAYTEADYDVSAFVALSLERVIFLPGIHPTFRASTADFLRTDGEAQSWERALQVFKHKRLQ